MIRLKIFAFILRNAIRAAYLLSFKKSKGAKSLLIEAGKIGWEHIDYNEQYNSAIEYLGEDKVFKAIIDKDQSYLYQVEENFKNFQPSHYFYDCRSGSSNPFLGLIESFRITLLCYKYNIIPICHLTDLAHVPWRLQAELMSLNSGIVSTLMSPKDIRNSLQSKRIVGPVPMAFSKITYKKIKAATKDVVKNIDVSTIGSMYEPRKTFINELQSMLLEQGIKLQVFGREVGSKRLETKDYWQVLASSKCVVTTGYQMSTNQTDSFSKLPHLIYRYIECLAAGSILVANEVPSINRLLEPNLDFISFENSKDACKKIIEFLNNYPESENKYRSKMSSLIELNLFWLLIDYGLEEESLK